MKLTKRKINALIKDEEMAYKEYMEIFKQNPNLRKLKELANDEKSHANYLKRLKKRM